MKSIYKLMSVVFAFLLIGAVNTSAVSPDFDIARVEVNEKEVTTGDTNFVVIDRGQTLEVDVWVNGQAGGAVRDDVRVRSWVGGYEYGEIAEKSEVFKIESDGSYHRTLYVEIPNDIDADKNGLSETYTLHVEVFDRNNEERRDYTFKIDEKRHDLRVQDVVFRPGNSVDAGDVLFSTVRVENMGDKKEEDIQVRVSISELGVMARDYIDELAPEDNNIEDEESSGDVDLFFRIPNNAEAKDYQAKVELIYDRGHTVVSENFLVHVNGQSSAVADATVVSVDATSKDVVSGSAIYKVMIANFGENKVVYSAEVLGTGVWGTATVEPGFVTVNAGETGELLVKVAPNSGVSGTQSFTVKVKADGETVKELNLAANATGGLPNVRKGLEIGFAILAILLVILGLIIAFNKLKGSNEEEGLGDEETSAGQTYY
ncbi:hypothetical protein J4442_05305 [Candidatus Woesearchaeota archaeon]|nr:hypothetical protein [Candidatus Woesearchaeota archaeon]